jgi:ATP/maltotriose-dependent transcriptional regulator MalT
VYQAGRELRFAPRAPYHGHYPTQPLTVRELTVLGLLDSDLTREQLAAQLYVSVATVKTHLHAIARKLGVSDRRAIVERARSLGLLAPEGDGRG